MDQNGMFDSICFKQGPETCRSMIEINWPTVFINPLCEIYEEVREILLAEVIQTFLLLTLVIMEKKIKNKTFEVLINLE